MSQDAKEKGEKKGLSAYAVGFLIGVVAGKHGIPLLTHGLYIALVAAALGYNWGGC